MKEKDLTVLSSKLIGAGFDRIMAMKYSPGGEYFVVAGGRCIFIFSPEDFSLKRTLFSKSHINSIEFVENEIISFHKDGIIKCRSVKENIEKETKGPVITATAMNKHIIYCGSEDGDILEIEAENLNILSSSSAHESRINSVIFIEKENILISGDVRGLIKIWELQPGLLKEKTTIKGHGDEVLSLLYKNNTLISGGEDGLVNFWSLNDYSLIKTLTRKNGITSLKSIPGEDIMAITSSPLYYGDFSDDIIEIYSIKNDKTIHTLEEKLDGLRAIEISSDGKYILAGGFNESIIIWEYDEGYYKLFKKINRHRGLMRFIKFTPSGLVTVSNDGTIIFWDIEKGEIINNIISPARPVSIEASGRLIGVISSFNNKYELNVYDICMNNDICLSRELKNEVRAMSLSNDESFLATGEKNNIITIQSVREIPDTSFIAGIHEGPLETLCFSREGTLIASGGMDRNIIIWDLEKRKKLKTLTGHEGCINKLLFSKDRLFSGSNDGTVRIWDINSGENQIINAEWPIKDIIPNNDERLIIIITDRNIVELWDMENLRLLKRIRFNDLEQWAVNANFDESLNIDIAEYYDSILRIIKLKIN